MIEDLELRSAITGLFSRLEFDRSGQTFGLKRDIYRALGYRPILKPQDYWDRYRRGGIAKRIVEAFPKSTWRGGAEIVESDDAETDTAFEQACVALDQRLHLWQMFLRADIQAGLGHFSLILLGGPGKFEDPLERCPPDALKYLATFPERDITIESLVNDPTDERYGLPDYYIVNYIQNVIARPMSLTGRIHYSRIVHVVEGSLDHPLFGPPRLESVWNYLDDLTKCVGGGSEAFWKRVDGGKQLKLDPTLPMPTAEQRQELHNQIEEYTHELRRVLTTRGVDIQDLGSNVSSFAPQVSSIMDLIASTTGIPQRILMGSERGELASTTDQSNYDDRIEDRRNDFAEPSVVRPFIDRLIALGTLPTPKEYHVRWPEIKNMNDAQRMAMALQAATLNQTAGESVITNAEIRDNILGFEPLTDAQIAEEQQKVQDKADAMVKQQQALAATKNPAPDDSSDSADTSDNPDAPDAGDTSDDKNLKTLEQALTAALVDENTTLATSLLTSALRAAGDVEGHEFHGNQWTNVVGAIGQPDQGFTYNPLTDSSPTTGYAVSAHKDRELVVDAKTVNAVTLTEYVLKNQDLLKQSGNYLGGWNNPKDGKVYLDISTVVQTADEAQSLAASNNQLAYFDLEHGQSVPTKTVH